MGILHGRDIFTSKYITAEICDSKNELHYFPIKHTLGDYFPVMIDGHLYVFKIDGTRIKTYRHTLSKSFRVLQYNTSHFLPISEHYSELELALKKNGISHIDGPMYSIIQILGKKENKEFSPHEIKKMLKEVAEKNDEYSDETRDMITYLDHLRIDKIVTPVKRLGEFLHGDIMETDPKFYGTITSLHERADKGNQIITNAEFSPKIAWMKVMLITMMIAMVGFAIYWAYDQGWFDSFLTAGEAFEGISVIPTPGQFQQAGQKDSAYWQNNYTPESLRAAVDRGDVSLDELPPDIVKMIENVEPPQVQTP